MMISLYVKSVTVGRKKKAGKIEGMLLNRSDLCRNDDDDGDDGDDDDDDGDKDEAGSMIMTR